MRTAVLLLAAAAARADTPPTFAISFADTVSRAVAVSGSLRAAGQEADAAAARGRGAIGGLLPQLTVDGYYRYLAEIPALPVFPGKAPVDLAAHNNYSVGPSATWTLWDWGASYNGWRGAADRADAETAQRDLARRSVGLNAAVAYIQAQMAAEQVRLLVDAVHLAATQHRDITLRQSTGAASRLETLQAHQELLARQRGLAQARADLAASLMELFVLTGTGTGLDASAPLDARAAAGLRSEDGRQPDSVEPPTLFVALDPLDEALKSLTPAAAAAPDPAHPRVRYFDRLASAARRAASGLTASRLPKLQVSGRISYDYPNGPLLEQITQKAVAVSASLPLFTGSKLTRDAEEQRDHATALEAQRDSARADLARDWGKAASRYALLRGQDALNRQASAEAKETADLVYASYKGGQSRYLEVETANLRLLEAQVQETRTKAEMLTQLAIMHSLSKED